MPFLFSSSFFFRPFRSSTSFFFSDLSSSARFSFKSSASRAIVKSKHSDVVKVKANPSDQNLTATVKKFMGSKPKTGNHMPVDFIAEDLKKTAKMGTNFEGLHKKIFGKGTASSEMKEREAKALTEVKSNTRTLAMVLRSERELLSLNRPRNASRVKADKYGGDLCSNAMDVQQGRHLLMMKILSSLW